MESYKEPMPTGDSNESFKELGVLEKTTIENIPENALKHFEGKSARFILSEKYIAGNFEEFYILHHTNEDLTYIGEQLKIYDENTKEKNIYFYETRNGEKIGHGEMRIGTSEDSKVGTIPFVGYTKTEEEYLREGLGERRLREMSAYAKMKYNQSIYSDSLISAESENLWKKLVTEGKAGAQEIRGKVRYTLL